MKVRLKGDLLAEFKTATEQASKKVLNNCIAALQGATPVDTGEARDGWHLEGKNIVNNVEHIQFLNEGSSEQAPSHFIERTLLSQKGIRPSGTIVRPM